MNGGLGLAAALLLLASSGQAATIPVAADSHISSSAPSSNFGQATSLHVGSGASALIAFDLSSLPAGLTASSIAKATITVFVSDAKTVRMDVAQVTTPWSESLVTYNTRPATGAVFQHGVPVSSIQSYVTFDITSLVQQWVMGGRPNPRSRNQRIGGPARNGCGTRQQGIYLHQPSGFRGDHAGFGGNPGAARPDRCYWRHRRHWRGRCTWTVQGPSRPTCSATVKCGGLH